MSRLLLILLFAAAAFAAWKQFGATGAPALSFAPDRIAGLAASAAAGDTIFFTTAACPHCATAKAWLQQHGFAFTDCDLNREPRCLDDYRRHNADGTPFLLVRGQPMRDGFDSDQYLALLAR